MATSGLTELAPPNSTTNAAALAFLYEHPRWFAPIFAELERRGVPFDVLYSPEQFFAIEPGARSAFRLVFNRMSPSADRRGNGSSIYYTLAWLRHLELQGVRVLNGSAAYQYEISKAMQHTLIQSLGLRTLPTRVIHRPEQAIAAASGLRFPIVVKPNVGGSGAGIVKYETREALAAAVHTGTLSMGYDSLGLVQEFTPARGGYITRVETLGGRFLYGIQVHLSGQTFDLCPADICQTTRGEALAVGLNSVHSETGATVSNESGALGSACVLEAAKSGLKVEGYTPPPEVIRAVERIVAAAGIDVGGIEYLVDDRDGEIYYYDVNALSNFVADPLRVIGFDPFARLADYLEAQLAQL